MQRLADRIYREFAFADQPVEIHALDGNGDMFQVYNGPITDLSAYNFVHVLRDPGCFYFFTIAYCPAEDGPDPIGTINAANNIIRRDLCWLTDPLPPVLEHSTDNTLTISWDAVRFCGIDFPNVLESVTYSIEVAEGVDWKEGILSRYINDMTALNYREVCNLKHETAFELIQLKPATFYHIRLVIHYLGFRVISEALTVHTKKSLPSPPGEARIQIIPIMSSFDPQAELPSRLEMNVTWTASRANGSSIQRYQVHIKRFDQEGNLLHTDPPLSKKKHLPSISADKAIANLVKPNKKANQWIQSKGKSLTQLQNSMSFRSPSRTGSRRDGSQSLSPPNSPHNPHTPYTPHTPHTSKSQGSFFPNSPPSSPTHAGSSPSSWQIVYDNLSRTVRLATPTAHEAEWWVRIRAKNGVGWGDFSPTLVISRGTHPAIFSSPPLPLQPPAQSQSTTALPPPSRGSSSRPSSQQAGGADSGRGAISSAGLSRLASRSRDPAEEPIASFGSMGASRDAEERQDPSITKFEMSLRNVNYEAYAASKSPPASPPSPKSLSMSLLQPSSQRGNSNNNNNDFLTQPNLVWNRPAIHNTPTKQPSVAFSSHSHDPHDPRHGHGHGHVPTQRPSSRVSSQFGGLEEGLPPIKHM